MRYHPRPTGRRPREGATTVELAVLLPFLCFLFAVAVDYARIFYFGVTLENCARNGAYYASNYPNNSYVYSDIYGYKTLDEAILADASSMYSASDPFTRPTYTVQYSANPDGPWSGTATSSTRYVHVTVNWTFRSLTSVPGIPAQTALSRSVTMKVAPAMPTFPSGG
jgi:Flp pilus assembly protein TadG